jgi:hypothetical protein
VWPYDPIANTVTSDCGYAVRHLDRCLTRIGMAIATHRLADRHAPAGASRRSLVSSTQLDLL